MPLTGHQVHLIQSTFEKVVVDIDQSAALFYARVFELDPSLKPLFKNDMRVMGRKLMQTLVFAVNSLNSPQQIETQMQSLGKRHNGYGVKREDFQTMGVALLWTLEKGLGESYTPEVHDAWTAMYQMLADNAIEGTHA